MDELKTIIRALAISNAANGITVAQLNKDFKNLEGYAIPYTKYGFQSLDGMLRTMTDAIQVTGYGPTAVMQPLSNAKSQHVREMVKKNKPDRKKPSAKYYHHASQANHRNYFYHDQYSSHLTSDEYDSNGFDDEIPYSETFVTMNGTNDKEEKQQQYYNRHGDEHQNTNGGVYNSPTSFNDTHEERHKKREEILAKLQKQISARAANNVTVPDSTKPTKEPMNESFNSSKSEFMVPVDAMTRKEKIVDALPGKLLPGTTVKVVVTSVRDPKRIYVHLLEHTDKLTRLAPHIDNIYSTKATGYEWLIPDELVRVGMYCAAKYHNRWYRAQVMGPVNFQRVLLSYIDYGYLRYVPLAEVRFLMKELSAIPCQSVRVALKHVTSAAETWSQECCEQLANMVHRKVFDMSVVNVDGVANVLEVILIDPDGGSLNEQLAARCDIAWSAD
ncbi:tudor domain-containing protein 1-like [Anopheles stephensi]|uniref:tudor domain-containing protein 1-like n=1 Tax=Anopheles stephensi TaxID=30069 RepID=UPI0007D11D7C|nr:tudor domain-containing protein 1-like [Anopheles stephensi]